jgi:hypothetical protein
MFPVLQGGNVLLKSFTGWIFSPGISKSLMFSGIFLYIGTGLINGGHDSPGAWIRISPRMDGFGSEFVFGKV